MLDSTVKAIVYTLDTRVYKPIKTVAIASMLAICVMHALVTYLEFCPKIAPT